MPTSTVPSLLPDDNYYPFKGRGKSTHILRYSQNGIM
jgi:hypothetical protein